MALQNICDVTTNSIKINESPQYSPTFKEGKKGNGWFLQVFIFWILTPSDLHHGREKLKHTNLQALPISIIRITSSAQFTWISCRPTTWTCCLPSSNTRNFAFLFKRSNNWIWKEKKKKHHCREELILKKSHLKDFYHTIPINAQGEQQFNIMD